MVSTTIYGIKNCDTIKKARKWLDNNQIEYNYHDFRIDGISKPIINEWLKQLEWESLLNTRGTTWRKLDDERKSEINKAKAIALMLEQPAIIKRPVLSYKNKYHLGFKEDIYLKIFS